MFTFQLAICMKAVEWIKIIRPGFLWGEQWSTWFRISTGTPVQMQSFIEKTEEALKVIL